MGNDSDMETESEGSEPTENYRIGLADMIKVTAEMNGVSNMSEDALNDLCDNTTYILKLILQQSTKFMEKNNHVSLTMEDVALGMKSRGVEPVFGFISQDPVLFKHARGGGKDFFFTDEKELELTEIVNSPLPKVPLMCTLKGHWLAIEGVQPAIPENPVPPANPEEPSSSVVNQPLKSRVIEDGVSKIKSRLNTTEKVYIKELTTHELSLEQQFYLREICEACVGSDENRRSEALESLKVDTGLAQMIPRLCNFISEGVKINTVQNNLALLIYLMRMCKALVDNSNLNLETYLHELIPSIFSCIVSRQLCLRPHVDNHWALREFAARLLCQVCRAFNSSTNQLQTRITNVLSSTLGNDLAPLATHYGSIFCLGEFGTESIKAFIFPHVSQISQKLSSILDNSVGLVVSDIDRTAADLIKSVLLKILPPVIRQVQQSPDSLEEYQADYGNSLGPLLHSAVMKLRQQQNLTTPSLIGQFSTSLVSPRGPLLSMGAPRSQQAGQSQVVRAPAPRNPSIAFPGSAFLSSGTTATVAPQPQKVLVITSQQRLQSSSAPTNNVQPAANPGTSHFVRLIHAGSTSLPNQPTAGSNNDNEQ